MSALTFGWWMVPIAIALFAVFMEVWVELDETKEPLNYKKHVHHRLGVAVWAISGMLWVRYL